MAQAVNVSKRERGFTLIEVIVAIAVITLLAGTVIPMVSGVTRQGQAGKILSVVDTLKKACSRYRADTGLTAREYSGANYADAANSRLSMQQTTAGWAGPYLDHPLAFSDSPVGQAVHVYDVFSGVPSGGFDLPGAGSDTVTGAGNYVRFSGITEELAQMVDDALDRGLTTNWATTGQVEWASNVLYIYLLDT